MFYVTPMKKSDNSKSQDLRQVWFPGDHGCVGGGTENNRQLSDAALEWMMNEARKKGLDFQLNTIEDGIITDPTAPFKNSSILWDMKVRQLSDDSTVNGNPEASKYVYATFDDLHESAKKRWCLTDYRPEGLELFATKLQKSCL
jgi:hypothetical protein